ncbi:MAG TPA: hypothetical protein VN578_06330 [Candidatus Binatia bacterium]|jgi:hypothetical protein|nr:hypothetical protein [Candidatus Binatia bacterium]
MTKTKMTQSKLASILGVSRQLIAHHIKTKKGPLLSDVDGWIEHLAAIGREGSLPPEIRKRIAKERLRILQLQAERMEMENAAKRREVVSFADAQRFIQNLVANCFFGELERMAQEFPPTLKGKTEIQINEEVIRQIEQVKVTLQGKLDEWERMGKKP